MATNDVKLTPADLARDFSCALGVQLTPEGAPRTVALIGRAAIDTRYQSDAAKTFYHRPRPYRIDPGPVCQSPVELGENYNYPSGHTTHGWTWASILARLAPDRDGGVGTRSRLRRKPRGLRRAQSERGGERVLSATATMNVVSATPAFQRDLAAAQAELNTLRTDPAITRPDTAACATEAALVAQRVY